MTRDAHGAIESKNYRKVREINSDVKSLLQQTEFIQELENFEKRRKNNVPFQLIYRYMKMVERLLLFRHATRSDDWLLHLKSTEDIIPDIISMDRIKHVASIPG